MHKDIQEAIRKNLSGEVSEQLQKVLKQGEQDADKVERLLVENRGLKQNERSRNELQDGHEANKIKEAELQKRETLLAVAEGKQEIREQMHAGFMDQYNLMWAQTFSSAEGKTLAFSLYGTVPAKDQNGYPITQPVNMGGTITDQ